MTRAFSYFSISSLILLKNFNKTGLLLTMKKISSTALNLNNSLQLCYQELEEQSLNATGSGEAFSAHLLQSIISTFPLKHAVKYQCYSRGRHKCLAFYWRNWTVREVIPSIRTQETPQQSHQTAWPWTITSKLLQREKEECLPGVSPLFS